MQDTLLQIMLYLSVFISGLFFGSFLNLVSDRIINKKSILFGRSICDFCEKALRPLHLVPLFSYLFQRGKCAFCKKKLSKYYPLSELLTGFLFVGAAYLTNVFKELNFFSVLGFFYFLVMLSFYVVLFLTDLKYKLLPNKVVYSAIIFAASFLVITTIVSFGVLYYRLVNDSFGAYLLEAGYFNQQVLVAAKGIGTIFLSAFGIGLFFWLLVFITKGRGMGGGDIKLGFLIGIVNGFPFNVIAIFLGFIIGAVYSVSLILLKKKTMKDTIAFGPFLILGSIIAIVWGPYIWNWYTSLL
ncbi:prepilin peptidase [Patescibacteria group bacterium]|nr:prepilin peptidase [Patescibacteria group bacterium]